VPSPDLAFPGAPGSSPVGDGRGGGEGLIQAARVRRLGVGLVFGDERRLPVASAILDAASFSLSARKPATVPPACLTSLARARRTSATAGGSGMALGFFAGRFMVETPSDSGASQV